MVHRLHYSALYCSLLAQRQAHPLHARRVVREVNHSHYILDTRVYNAETMLSVSLNKHIRLAGLAVLLSNLFGHPCICWSATHSHPPSPSPSPPPVCAPSCVCASRVRSSPVVSSLLLPAAPPSLSPSPLPGGLPSTPLCRTSLLSAAHWHGSTRGARRSTWQWGRRRRRGGREREGRASPLCCPQGRGSHQPMRR